MSCDMRWVRCIFATPDHEHEVTADVLIDRDQRVAAGLSYHGKWETSEDTYPVSFLSDGSVDYGSEYGGGQARYGAMRLHGQRVSENGYFEYTEHSRLFELTITRVRDLAYELECRRA